MDNVRNPTTEKLRRVPSSGFESGGRRGRTTIQRTLTQHLPRGHPLDAYESDWDPKVRQMEWLLESLEADPYTSVNLESRTITIYRTDLRHGNPMPVAVWEKLNSIKSASGGVDYDDRLARFTIPKSETSRILNYFDENYSAVKDEWVLRHLLYRWKSREKVANRLDVSVGKAEYWCDYHNIQLPWKNELVLDTAYRLLNESTGEVAGYLNCGGETVRRWLDIHEIKESTPNDGLNAGQLERLFVDERLSMAEIGRRLGCSPGKVSYWLDAHDIERPEDRANGVRYMSHKGYPCWFFDQEGAKRRVRVHRLAAVAEYGFDRVAGKIVHHKSGVPWDNRLSNLSLLTNEQHSKHHNLSQNE